MSEDAHGKIMRLIREYFPWDQVGYPEVPVPDTPDAREEKVRLWLEGATQPFRSAALALIARVSPVLQELEDVVCAREGRRLFKRFDVSALVKSPESILEKMVREWDGKQNPMISFDRLSDKLDDVSRFRIVANFLSDVKMIANALESPYGAPTGGLSPAQIALKQEYHLVGNGFRDSIHLQPEDRKRGERCCKGVFHPRNPSFDHLKVEVQVQTLLQEAWDKKDHFLIYEPRRRGEEIDPLDTIEIFAMSELLYVADLTFDRLKITVEGRRGK